MPDFTHVKKEVQKWSMLVIRTKRQERPLHNQASLSVMKVIGQTYLVEKCGEKVGDFKRDVAGKNLNRQGDK